MANPNPSPRSRFKLGGPPGPGRPKGSLSLKDLLRIALEGSEILGEATPDGRPVAVWFVEAMVKHGMGGNGSYMREIMDRIDGPIPRAEGAPEGDIDAILDEADRIATDRERSTFGRAPGAIPG